MANSDISVPSVDHRQEPSSHYHILNIRPCSRLDHIPPLHSRSNPGSPDGACLQDRPPHHKTRCSIPHNGPEDRQRNIIQRLERQSKQTHWRIRQNYRHRRPDQPRPTAPPPPLSRQILAVNVANISNKRPAISPSSSGTPGSGPSQRPASPHLNSASLSLDSMSSSIQPRDLDAEESPSVSHLGSVYVGHSGATTNYSRREAFASIRQALDRVVPFDNNHPVLIFGDWNTDPQRLQRIVHSWGHGLTVMQFSGSQITRLSTVHGRRHSSIDHFVCNAPARALLTLATCGQTDSSGRPLCHSHIHSSRGSRTTPCSSCSNHIPPSLSRSNLIELPTSNYWDVLADGASDDTDTDT
ncbi:hypothetical protein BASA83_003753 [Batrachochytrium salamandrivorans]|nr:hypothetical protein BASA83_003753 [Batrachochytrium salamandrivorans]